MKKGTWATGNIFLISMFKRFRILSKDSRIETSDEICVVSCAWNCGSHAFIMLFSFKFVPGLRQVFVARKLCEKCKIWCKSKCAPNLMKISSMLDVPHTPFDLFGPLALVTTGSIETLVYFGATFLFVFSKLFRSSLIIIPWC